MAQVLHPFKLVESCSRFPRSHAHLISSTGTETCDTPLFILEREAYIITGEGQNPVEAITLLAKTKVSETPKKSTDKGSSERKTKKASKTSTSKKSSTNKLVPNHSITESVGGAAGEGLSGTACQTWNFAVIIPKKMRDHLPWPKYTDHEHRPLLQLNIVGKTLVVSHYVPPSEQQDSHVKE